MAEQYKTEAVVLHSIAHAEKGHIAYLYTRLHGRVAYYIYSARNGMASVGGVKISLQPLNMINIVGEFSTRSELHHMKEAKKSFLATLIYGDIVKSTLALYISEFIYRIIKDREPNPMLYDYIAGSIKALNELNDKQTVNFHLYFTINISRFLGFYPSNSYFEGSYFDMAKSKFVVIKPLHSRYLSSELSHLFALFCNSTIESIESIPLNHLSRRALLEGVIDFFGCHHETIYKIESLKVLGEIF